MHSLPIYINYVCVRFRKSVNDRSFWTSDNSGIKFQQQNQQVYRYFSIYIYSEQGGIFYGPKLVNNERS